MDALTYITGGLGVIVTLAGFWAFMGTQFVRKDVLEVEHKRFDEKLDGIAARIDALSESYVVKSTINELAGRLADIYDDRQPARRDH